MHHDWPPTSNSDPHVSFDKCTYVNPMYSPCFYRACSSNSHIPKSHQTSIWAGKSNPQNIIKGFIAMLRRPAAYIRGTLHQVYTWSYCSEYCIQRQLPSPSGANGSISEAMVQAAPNSGLLKWLILSYMLLM